MNQHHTMNSITSSIVMDDAMSDPSSPESSYDESSLIDTTVHDDVQAQLAAAGPIGVAAAAAIASGKKRKKPHSFETNPAIRKRQQTRLLRKLKNTIDEYTTRVGQQAIVLTCTPGKTTSAPNAYKVFGSQPLEGVIKGNREPIMQDLEVQLAQQAPPAQPENSSLHELPPLVIDGIPTPVDKMTQAQLRAFIPEMLKYSTGRSKPGWGKPECRPIWWPSDLPWANVRSDVRTDEEKKKVSWTHALRTIVKNCYKHHGRDDLLPEFAEDNQSHNQHHHHHQQQQAAAQFAQQTMVQTINNPDGTMSIIQIDTGDGSTPQVVTLADGTQAQVVHAVSNLTGTSGVPGTHFIALADGSAQIVRAVHGLTNGHTQEASQAVQTLAEVASHHNEVGTPVSVEMAEIGQNEGQIILTDGGLGSVSDGQAMVTIPVSMYQTVVTSMAGQMGDQQSHQAITITPTVHTTDSHGDALSHSLVGHVQTKLEPSDDPKDKGVPTAAEAVEVMSVDQVS